MHVTQSSGGSPRVPNFELAKVRGSAFLDTLDEQPIEPRCFAEAELREIHRSIYEAFERKPDGANILQGVREFRKGRPHVRITMVPSPKNGGAFIACEGRLEARAALSFEIDPDVRRYRAQPFSIANSTRKGLGYVPDFVVEHHDGTFTIVDVKPVGRLLDPKVTARMGYVRRALKDARLSHRLITEVDLDQQPIRQIRESLRKGVRIEMTPVERQQLTQQMGDSGMKLRDLRSQAIALGLSPYAAETLALLGDINFPINTQWSESAHLEVNHGNHQAAAAMRGTVRDVRIAL